MLPQGLLSLHSLVMPQSFTTVQEGINDMSEVSATSEPAVYYFVRKVLAASPLCTEELVYYLPTLWCILSQGQTSILILIE